MTGTRAHPLFLLSPLRVCMQIAEMSTISSGMVDLGHASSLSLTYSENSKYEDRRQQNDRERGKDACVA
jgi:hypothetical protein